MPHSSFRTVLSAVALLTAVPALAQAPTQAEADAQRSFDTFKPVGMAVAYIADGKLVFARGYGVKRLGGAEPVDADTVFPIASMTKAFTAAALAMLVDEGKLGWDDKVVAHIPEFAMSDPYVTREMTVRDLLVHRSGLALGAGDLLIWPDGDGKASDTIAALKYLPLDKGFRSGFIYDNALYVVAGELVARRSGMAWADFVRTRIFDPLGMASCNADPLAPRSANRAAGHSRAGDRDPPKPVAIRSEIPDPAGSIACSVRDVARWAQFQLDGGVTPEGKRLVGEANMGEMTTGVTPMRTSGMLRRLGGSHLTLYALGWIVSDFRGELIVEHGGTAPGGITNLVMLPERKAAAIVLTNDYTGAHVLAYQLVDDARAADKAADWIGDVARREAARATTAPPPAETTPPADGKPPALPLAAYTGTYRDPWYGDIVVAAQGKGLTIHFTRSRAMKGPLLPFDGETFLARWPDRSLNADALVSFEPDSDGRPAAIKVRPASPDIDFSYDYAHLKPVRVR